LSRVATAQSNAPAATVEAPQRDILSACIETTKPGITKLVTITAMVGMAMALAQRWAGPGVPWSAWQLLLIASGATLGTALSAAGANALNQWWERDRDALMPRTARRPLPAGELPPAGVLALGLGLVAAGLGVLWLAGGPAATAVSLACVLVYVLIYTPLKPLTWTATLVGAVPGALPPLIGWCAAHREAGFAALADPGGVSLFMLMFVWQIPHFLAIAWMYREDYARGGCAVLPVIDRTGSQTALTIAAFTVLLTPATIGPVVAMPDVLGQVTLFSAAVTGLLFAALVARLLRTRRREHARAVFFASIAHLPLLLGVMVLDGFARVLLFRA
jgi:heme o synthase